MTIQVIIIVSYLLALAFIQLLTTAWMKTQNEYLESELRLMRSKLGTLYETLYLNPTEDELRHLDEDD